MSVALPLSAQWIEYPSKGVPRLPDGSLNMSAPAPRTPEDRPDFSGIWLNKESLPCPPSMTDRIGSCIEMVGLPKQAPNVGIDIEGGLPYTEWSKQQMEVRKSQLDPHVYCLPANPPRMFTLPHYNKILQTSDVLAILNEFNASYRQIFTDDRPLPEDPSPSWNGYSSGRWEGDTLVVRTNGMRDGLWLDMRGSPMTGGALITERFHRPNFGTLEIDFTVEDPQAYTKPWTIKIRLARVADTELIDEFCLEGERSAEHMTVGVTSGASQR